MDDRALEEIAAQRGWDERTVARLRDAAYVVMQLRTFREHMNDIIGDEPGSIAQKTRREVDAYVRPTVSNAENMIAEYGADAGHDGSDAMALWQGLSRVYYRVPGAEGR